MAGNELLPGGNIAGIERVRVVTREAPKREYVLDTATSAAFEARVSAGAEHELRVGNEICGLIRTEDILKGYDVELEDARYHAQLLALIGGGECDGLAYAAAAAGTAAERVAFDLYLYTADRAVDGSALRYHEWKFPFCKGRPVDAAFKDGEFAQLKYKLTSRPGAGEAPLSVRAVEALPEV